MKVLIVYDSVSKEKMTEKVAGLVRDGLKEGGVEVDSFFVKDAGSVKVEDYDCLIVGTPTMAWKPTDETKKFLGGLEGKQLSGKMASCFDTQMRSFISGNANKAMSEKLAALGFKLVGAPLQSYVAGGKEGYHFKEAGEADKAKAWGKDLAAAVAKK
ncbi:MAG: flavodoxin domain-containing protein [Methanomassiliicoccales archaeon]|jgi:flavodoxin